MPDLVLSLLTTGPPDHPRFQISNPDSKFWTGENWTVEESKARLYACLNDAGRAIQKILLAEHGDKPLRRFVAPVCVEPYADTDLTLDEISDWLVKVARLTIDAETHGKPSVNPITNEEITARRRRIRTNIDLPMKDEYGQLVRDLVSTPVARKAS